MDLGILGPFQKGHQNTECRRYSKALKSLHQRPFKAEDHVESWLETKKAGDRKDFKAFYPPVWI